MMRTAWCALTLAATLLFFPALRVYAGNHLHYQVSLGHAVFWLAVATALAAVPIAATAAAFRARRAELWTAGVLALACYFWFKGAFLAWDYGVLGGQPTAWDDHAAEGRLDLAALALALAAFFAARERVTRRWRELAGFLAIVQAASLAFATPLARAGDRAAILAKHTVEVEPRAAERLSERHNVILLIVDTLQSDVLAAWLHADPRRREALAGFTFFPDAASAAGLTWVSVPNLLTGTVFDNRQPYADYLDAAFHGRHSVLKNLRAAGYYVELEPWGTVTPVPRDAALVSNLRRSRLSPAVDPLASMAMVGAYTVMPQVVKQRTQPLLLAQLERTFEQAWDNNLTFMRDLERLPVEMVSAPVAKLIHLRGAHPPLLEYAGFGLDYERAARQEPAPRSTIAPFTRANYELASAQVLGAVERYLAKLKAAGVYHAATIVVLGDHGGGRLGQRLVAGAATPFGADRSVISSGLQVAASAALMAKPASASGPLRVASAPVALADVASMINRLVGVAPAAESLPLCSAPSGARARRFLDVPDLRFDAEGRLPLMVEYLIEGPLWLEASWRPSGRRFSPRGIAGAPPYQPGAMLEFGQHASGQDYLGVGWRVPMAGERFAWTDGYVARLQLPLPAPVGAGVSLEIDAASYVGIQRAVISVNGVPAGELKVAEARAWHAVTLPGRVAASERLEVRLDLPDAISPSSARKGRQDEGLLALKLFSMRVRRMPSG